MRTFYQRVCLAILIAAALATFFSPADLASQPAALEPSRAAPIDIVTAYLRATQARDWQTAYRYLSSIDRSVRDEKTYLRSQEIFAGFALDLAKRLTNEMDVWVIEQELGSIKAHIDVGYRVPTGDEISMQLLDWIPDKLNALTPSAQATLLEVWEKLKTSGKLITIEGRETFDLVSERGGWKIFLDWRSRHRVAFKTTRPRPAELEVKFLRNDLLVKTEEPFQVDFKVTNRTDRDVVVKLNHLFEPRRMEKHIDMIACGSLLPLRLRPRQTQDISSSYLLRGNLPARTQLAIIYDFDLVPKAEMQKPSQLNEVKSK